MADFQPQPDDILLEWHFPEYPRYDRGRWWYVGFFGVAALLIIEGIWTKNYLLIAIVVLAFLTLLFRIRRHPHDMRLALTDRGVWLNSKFYPWTDFRTFWIHFEPPAVKKLSLIFKGPRPALDVSLEKQNPLKAREVLSEFLPEDTEPREESMSDQLTRRLKI